MRPEPFPNHKITGSGESLSRSSPFFRSLLGVAVIAAIYGWALRRSSMFSLSMGAATVWASLLILSAFMFPGASYVLTWPLLFFSIASAFQMTRQTAGRDEERGTDYKQIALGFLGSIPALLIVMPVLYLIFVGLTVLASGIAAIFIALLFGLLVPNFQRCIEKNRKC
jgi:hypothetical protein